MWCSVFPRVKGSSSCKLYLNPLGSLQTLRTHKRLCRGSAGAEEITTASPESLSPQLSLRADVEGQAPSPQRHSSFPALLTSPASDFWPKPAPVCKQPRSLSGSRTQLRPGGAPATSFPSTSTTDEKMNVNIIFNIRSC